MQTVEGVEGWEREDESDLRSFCIETDEKCKSSSFHDVKISLQGLGHGAAKLDFKKSGENKNKMVRTDVNISLRK